MCGIQIGKGRGFGPCEVYPNCRFEPYPHNSGTFVYHPHREKTKITKRCSSEEERSPHMGKVKISKFFIVTKRYITDLIE